MESICQIHRNVVMVNRDELEGGCLCGQVRYRFIRDKATNALNCHCTLCRRSAGAPYNSWFSISPSEFVLSGDLKEYQSSEHGTRRFCPICGTQITFQSMHTPDSIDVTISSLDEPEGIKPETDIFGESRLTWTQSVVFN